MHSSAPSENASSHASNTLIIFEVRIISISPHPPSYYFSFPPTLGLSQSQLLSAQGFSSSSSLTPPARHAPELDHLPSSSNLTILIIAISSNHLEQPAEYYPAFAPLFGFPSPILGVFMLLSNSALVIINTNHDRRSNHGTESKVCRCL